MFTERFQNSIDIEHISHEFIRITPILILEVGHSNTKNIHPNQIDDMYPRKVSQPVLFDQN